MIDARHLLSLLVGLLLVACEAERVAPAGDAELVAVQHPPGLLLTVELAAGDVHVLRREPLLRPLGHAQSEPELTDGDEFNGRVLHAALYDESGTRLDVQHWPADGLSFYHERTSNERPLTSTVAHVATVVKTIEVRLVDGAAFLALSIGAPATIDPHAPRACRDHPCIDCESMPDGARELEALAVYPLLVDRIPAYPTRFQHSADRLPHTAVGVDCMRHPLVTRMSESAACPFNDGELLGTQLIAGDGEAARNFDVVILGDGFTEAEMQEFDHWAARYRDMLIATEPFARLADRINVHTVRTASPESGVSHCPDETSRRTYYGVEGDWLSPGGVDRGGHGYLGTNGHCRVFESVKQIAPLQQVELIVMLAHCDLYGGRAEPWSNMVYLTTNKDGKDFENVAMHETGHTVGLLGEEYVACARPHDHYDYPGYFPNVVPREMADDAWWKALAREDELDDGAFVAIHRCEDGFESDDYRTQPSCPIESPARLPRFADPAARPEMLGLFWGGLYGVEGGDRNQCRVFCGWDEAGHRTGQASCDYFRPALRCRMRDIGDPFCRACEELICQAIRKVDPPGIECALDALPLATTASR